MSIARVRSLIGDMTKASLQERVGSGNGTNTIFQLAAPPIRTGTLQFLVSGADKIASAIVNLAVGTVDLTGSAPPLGDIILASYQFNALSDDEISGFLDMASAGSSLVAASYACRALVGNYNRWFNYSIGNKTVNKDNVGPKMLKLAEAFRKHHRDGGHNNKHPPHPT